jgi:hypothetical protein
MPAHTSISYVESDVPDGMTLAQWRRARCAVQRTPTRGLRRLWRSAP